ncbi:PAAR domain-containing protein [Burkholderia sp. AU30198]|uniref:PAAR domain-containing protein n=1 Tax=Burkholderia sp. AU30198 TaxID=2879627 RepID=UPI001CF5C61C|nr:PAAR domain-containing protein [Burkholderia sp. AU30198]MCA8293515.1 PAAR domain-containing protein [Burkholderia sp. AU30198]
MSRRAVRVGDPTTTGGIVISGSSDMTSDNKTIAVNGDWATCRNCEGMFSIAGSAVGVISNGRCMALEGDSVLCPCGHNLLIAGSDCTFFYEDDGGHSAANLSTASSAFARVTQASASGTYDEQFVLADDFGRPLANVRYRVVTDSGQILTGMTDSAGRTRRFVTDMATSLKIYAMGF